MAEHAELLVPIPLLWYFLDSIASNTDDNRRVNFTNLWDSSLMKRIICVALHRRRRQSDTETKSARLWLSANTENDVQTLSITTRWTVWDSQQFSSYSSLRLADRILHSLNDSIYPGTPMKDATVFLKNGISQIPQSLGPGDRDLSVISEINRILILYYSKRHILGCQWRKTSRILADTSQWKSECRSINSFAKHIAECVVISFMCVGWF